MTNRTYGPHRKTGLQLGSIRLRTNPSTAAADADYARWLNLPPGFGAAELTFALWIRLETLSTGPGGGVSLVNWANDNPTPYSSSSWWFNGNFLLDGHNNTAFRLGTFSFQVFNSGCPRLLVGDNAPELLTAPRLGELHAAQDATLNLRDSQPHLLAAVRRFTGGSASNWELWVDDALRATVASTVRTDMTTYWSSWSGYPEAGWVLGGEKRHIFSAQPFWEDFKGWVGRTGFWNRALTPAQLGNLRAFWPTPGLVGRYRMPAPDGANRIYDDASSSRWIECVQRSQGAIWVAEQP